MTNLSVQVEMYTAYHDPKRCFQETADGTLNVKVHGGWFPRTIFGLAHAFCAYIRCILVAFAIAWHSRRYQTIFRYYKESSSLQLIQYKEEFCL